MSLPSQVNTDKSKHRTPAMKEGVQHTGEVYYGMGPPALKASHGESASSSAVYNPEKGHQSLPHYQQPSSVKWMQDSIQAPGWTQEAPVAAWGQNFGTYQMPFHKGVHEGVAMPMGAETQLSAPVEVYRDASQAQTQGRGHEWEQHAAVMHQAQLQAYQHGHKGVDLQAQPHVPGHTMQGPILQPFQASFRPNKQQFSSGYYPVFPANKGMIYGEQSKTQQQLLHQMQQQQMHHHHHQQQQQQHMHQQQQHHHQLQQLQQQQQQQQQMQQQQIQQQQLQQQIQQQYHQQQLQEQQQLQQMQQMQQQNVPQPETTPPQVQPNLQQQTPNFGAYPLPEPLPPDSGAKKEDTQPMEPQPEAQARDASALPDACAEKVAATDPLDSADSAPAAPRRSRRLSREGQSPLGPPPANMWSQVSKEPAAPPQNGVAGVTAAKGAEGQAATGGVIQTARRRRRASKEINLETLAQKASEMESLPAKAAKEDAPATIVPLVIPVSVPVHKNQAEVQGGWAQGRVTQGDRAAGQADRKPSVIVARRRSLRNSVTESFGQDGESDSGMEEDGKPKSKRRTRPEPLIIPPPKPSTFIPPSVYSSITPYQSNLRSPVRLPDLHALPPYTPPPILSPVRGGTGLYFSAFLTNIAVSNQILPPPATPKSAARSLLRSTSSDITPPVLPLITDATPVCLEPRINIGPQYQAEIPDLQDQLSSQSDQHKADLVWLPLNNGDRKQGDEETMEHFMSLACSSVFRGGGTNQELVLHSLHECGGKILETLERLMLQDPVFPRGHHLAGYHYSGSDSWTAEEKCYFNKGISLYRKDFFLVQKLVRTKTVAQCVEFYYTYKKQVKVGRNGILTYGPPESPVDKHSEAVVDIKSSHHPKLAQGEAEEEEKKEASSYDDHESKQQARVAQSLQAHDYVTGTVLVIKEPDPVRKEAHHSSVPHRPRAEAAAKKAKAPPKPPQDPNEVFPCKKCGRVFHKVKSRSAHMKSHAEQEKKAAALRLKEEEEKAAAQARARKVAAAAAAAAEAAAHQGGDGDTAAEQGEEVSSQEDSSEREDDDDEDWH
ncbi:mitotic deacetylase associated SANT domain protein a [Fundulus heteroclitus]|uniref:mitotic deacetylase associated SANT domain protein a n=1 Tax=Fundulus heteroclitus TaxID=8078 RepID=UPI00165BA57A|nr:mitotic deacetylase associated SANT domain protein a [Fundulus heteroclitus]